MPGWNSKKQCLNVNIISVKIISETPNQEKPQAFLVRFPSNLSWPADAGQNSTEAANLDNDVNDNIDDHPN